MHRGEWGLLVTLTVLWSGSFLFAKVALAEVGPLTVVLARVGIAAGALIVVMALTGDRLPMTATAWRAFAVMGVLNNVLPQGLISWGMLHIDSGLASMLNAATPLFSVLLAHAAGRERATVAHLAGVMVGLVGVAVLVGPAALRGVRADVIGQICVLGAAVSYACAGLYGRRLLTLSPAGASAGMLAAAALALLALALFSTAAGYVVYFMILRTAGPTNLLLVTLLMPIGAIGLGAAVLGERLSLASLLGAALIFTGLAIIDGRLRGARLCTT